MSHSQAGKRGSGKEFLSSNFIPNQTSAGHDLRLARGTFVDGTNHAMSSYSPLTTPSKCTSGTVVTDGDQPFHIDHLR